MADSTKGAARAPLPLGKGVKRRLAQDRVIAARRLIFLAGGLRVSDVLSRQVGQVSLEAAEAVAHGCCR